MSQLSARLSGHHLIIKYYDQRVSLFPQKIIRVELYAIAGHRIGWTSCYPRQMTDSLQETVSSIVLKENIASQDDVLQEFSTQNFASLEDKCSVHQILQKTTFLQK